MQTQQQMFYQSHRKIAERFHAIDWIAKQDNKPTLEELEILRKKNPAWNSYPEAFAFKN
jgi:hypothetical protein